MSVEEKEISFREFILKISEWFRFFLSKWLLIILFSGLCAGFGFLYAYTSTPKYSASESFVLSNQASGSTGGLMGLASQFGINMGGGETDVFSGSNIIALMKSGKMLKQVLFTKPEGKETLINILCKQMKFDEGWEAYERTKGAFPFPDKLNNLTLVQDSLVRAVYNMVSEDMLSVIKPEKDQNIYNVTTTSSNEKFSFYLTKYLVNETSAFYIETKTSAAKRNLSMLTREADSIRLALGGAIVSTGSATDLTFNLNPAYQVQRSGAQQSQVRAAALGEAYGEVLKNLELAKITLLKETPLYQIIDEPVLPLLQDKPGKLVSMIVGGFLGGIIAIAFLVVRRLSQSV